jgi:hypothetical protein
VDEVLRSSGSDDGYKARVVRMVRENEAMDPVREIERCVMEVATID